MARVSGMARMVSVRRTVSWIRCACFLVLLSLNPGELCGLNEQELTTWQGAIVSPDDGRGQYLSDQRYLWEIALSSGSRVRIQVEKFDLEPADVDGKCRDYVEISEGKGDQKQVLETVCGSVANGITYLSKSSHVNIVFVSDSHQQFSGFHLTYTGVCRNVIIIETDSVLQSPNYPGEPPDIVTCEWWIRAPVGFHPIFHVEKLDTEAIVCADAAIQIYDSTYRSWTICHGKADDIVVPGQRAMLHYRKDSEQAGLAFAINVQFTEIKSCIEMVCMNGGTCLHSGGSSKPGCSCMAEYTGTACEIEVNLCLSHPCNNGGTCQELSSSFRCICPEGYSGGSCNNDADYCASTPCPNNGSCTNGPNGFKCRCMSGFVGIDCNIVLDPCAEEPCKNKGVCEVVHGTFICQCSGTYTGVLCEEDIGACVTEPCRNGAVCVSFNGSYICECTLGYTGCHCETDINECQPNPCDNDASCHDLVNGFHCRCQPGFSGHLCDTELEFCNLLSCQNGGACLEHPYGFECTCPFEYTGSLCETRVDRRCDDNPCVNGATCRDVLGDLACHCSEHFTGKYCQVFMYTNTAHCISEVDDTDVEFYATQAPGSQSQPCPAPSTGHVTRQCLSSDDSGTGAHWEPTDYRNCTLPEIIAMYNQSLNLLNEHSVTKRDILDIMARLGQVISDNRYSLFPGDLLTASSILNTLARLISNTETDEIGLTDIAQGFGAAVSKLLSTYHTKSWILTNDKESVGKGIANILLFTEVMAENLARKLRASVARHKRGTEIITYSFNPVLVSKPNIEFFVSMNGKPSTDITNDSTYFGAIHISRDLLDLASRYAPGGAFGVYAARFTSVGSLLGAVWSSNRTHHQHKNDVINNVVSDVLSLRILGVNQAHFDALPTPVIIHLEKIRNESNSQMMVLSCAYLNATATSARYRWSTSGCHMESSNSTHMTCHCYHTTNFAVLMDMHDITSSISIANKRALSYLSYTGGTLSVLAGILAIFVFRFFRLKSDRIYIHTHLALSITLVQLVFLVGIQRKENKYVCKLFAMLLHYLLVAMFSWMLIEGLNLYLTLVRVFHKGRHIKKYLILGWGMPVVVMIISIGVFHDEYGQGDMCWMSAFMILVVFVPIVSIVILLNIVVLGMVVRVMTRSVKVTSTCNKDDITAFRLTLKASLVLLPLLGLTWLFGFLSIDSRSTLVFTYLFAICNTLQGCLFFMFHCLLSVDVRKAYDRRYRRHRVMASLNNRPTSSEATVHRGNSSVHPASGRMFSESSSTRSQQTSIKSVCTLEGLLDSP